MPRSGRGGRRTGTVGKQYANRSDMRNPTLPVAAATGQPYGAAGAQKAAQASLPMSGAPVIAPGAASPVTAPGGSPQGAPPPVTGHPAGLPSPGSMPPLDAPTNNPAEDLMTGVNAGPGPGTEVLRPLIAHPLVEGVAALNSLGSAATPQLKAIRDAVSAHLANQAAP